MRSQTTLNARSQRQEHEGVLIRVLQEDGQNGYGCIHTWPELGDNDLQTTLTLLAHGEVTPVSKKSLKCAELDAKARAQGKSLFDDLCIPLSHATLVMDSWTVMEAVDSGFRTVKLKVGKDLPREIFFIREQAFNYPQLRWRFDFNNTLTHDEVEHFLVGLGDDGLLGRIDFLEDAFQSGDPVSAYASEVPLAIDRDVASFNKDFDFWVIKPAVNDSQAILEKASQYNTNLVFTSYMDHPIGQCFAAYEAALAYRKHPDLIDVCGLQTHGLFQCDDQLAPFVKMMGSPAPVFAPPEGTGLGFDEILENLEWIPLT